MRPALDGGAAAPPLPLVVDLDGTLSLSDATVESFVQVVRRAPGRLPGLCFVLLRHGLPAFKAGLLRHAEFAAASLPLRESFVCYLREQRAEGRSLVLATASHEGIAEVVAARLGLFDKVIATRTGGPNLKGAAKLVAIREQVGQRFAYAGDSRADLAVWRGAAAMVLVAPPPSVRRRALALGVPVEWELSAAGSVRPWLLALRRAIR